MNKRRLLKLANLLEANAANQKESIQFDYGHWGRIDIENPLSCGTTACAMGYAAISGEFKREGLTYTIEDIEIEAAKHGDYRPYFVFVLKGHRYDGIEAAMRLFGLLEPEAEYLFIPGGGDKEEGAAAARGVANKIRHFVEAGGIPIR